MAIILAPLRAPILTSLTLVVTTLFSACVGPVGTDPVTRNFTIESGETLLELYPGKTVRMWTFNGLVPGPLIRVNEGDRVVIRFYNNHTLPHNLHFHGAHPVGMDGVEEVPPGGSFTYDFVAGPAGAYVYHCHVETRIHIQKGLYGQFIVDPKEGWGAPKPERDHYVVFSDWNPNLNATPEAYTINGRSFPSTTPFQAELGQTARFFVSSMSMIPIAAHFHGTLSEQVWPNPQPVDILTLAPGETRVIDYRSEYEGVWMFHDHFEDHLVNDASYPGGTIGLIQVGRDHWTEDANPHHHGGTAPSPIPVDDAAGTLVLAKDFLFGPTTLTVKVGTTVTWRNDDAVAHTVTSDDPAGPLDSGSFGKGASYSSRFMQPGVYRYHCVPHSGLSQGTYAGMVGTIIVDP